MQIFLMSSQDLSAVRFHHQRAYQIFFLQSPSMPRTKSTRPLPAEECLAMGRELRSSHRGAPAESTISQSARGNAEVIGKMAEGSIRKVHA